MLQIIYILSFLWAISGPISTVDAFPTAKAGVQIAYHVGDIVEHAYTNEAPAHPNPYPPHPQPPPPPPPPPLNLQQFTRPMVHNAGHDVPSSLSSGTSSSTSTTTTSTSTTVPSTTTTSRVRSSTPYQGQKKNDSVETQEDENDDDDDDEEDSSQTEQSLDAFLAMLEETRNVVPSTSERNRKREEPKVSASHFAPQTTLLKTTAAAAAAVPLSSTSSQLHHGNNGGLLLTITPQQFPVSQPRNPYEGWAVYDDLDTEESNQTAVIASDDQKFGYVVNGNNYKRFRVEEKASNGLITGLFGFHHNNGNIRGVQYTADPSISPKFLYDTLVKFVSS